ncbi:Hypothetical predicted protein, partial [Podarcis lilfordi]
VWSVSWRLLLPDPRSALRLADPVAGGYRFAAEPPLPTESALVLSLVLRFASPTPPLGYIAKPNKDSRIEASSLHPAGSPPLPPRGCFVQLSRLAF